MKRSSQRNSAGKVDSDRIGRMGARRRNPSIASQLARRLRGFRGRAGKGGHWRDRSSHPRPQRVIVKTHIARHKPGKARESLRRHAGYLSRDSASSDGKPGIFYDASRDAVDGRQEMVQWAPDRHHFRIIISPERGGDIPDMTAYVRQVMARVERDLTSLGAIVARQKLQWIAINHHNTDNPHAHIVLRGRQENGRDLVIPRAYIAHGMRARAVEVATELLGERTIEQAREARSKEVEAERFTSLDRIIQRHMEKQRIDLSPAKPIGFTSDDRQLVLGRLQFLEGIGLAQKDRGTWWRVENQFDRSLRQLGQRNDIIKQLYGSLGNEAGVVIPMGAEGATSPVAGVVIAKGNADELSDERFLVVRDSKGQALYARVKHNDAYRDLHVGSLVELGAQDRYRQQVAEQIVAIAKANDGAYSTPLHESYLRSFQPGWSEREVQSALRSASSRLAFIAGFERSGASATEGGGYQVDAERFMQFSQRSSRLTDARVIAARPLEEQIEAHAVTWLDRQIASGAFDDRLTDHPAVEEAVHRREEWLVRNGFAQRTEPDGPVRFSSEALGHLALEEWQTVTQNLATEHGQPVCELPRGGAVTGEYQDIYEAHFGKLAVVLTEDNVFVSPVRRTPDVEPGSTVNLERTSAQDARVELAPEQTLDLDHGLFNDLPGGDE